MSMMMKITSCVCSHALHAHVYVLQETQTKPEGQIHFFPVIFNGKQLYDVMVERCGPSQNSMPK
jgi:hypothetical protein